MNVSESETKRSLEGYRLKDKRRAGIMARPQAVPAKGKTKDEEV